MNLKLFVMKMSNLKKDFNKMEEELKKGVSNFNKKLSYYQLKFID
jgi:hypothetical protein